MSAGFHDRSARAHLKADGISQMRVEFATGRRPAGLLRGSSFVGHGLEDGLDGLEAWA